MLANYLLTSHGVIILQVPVIDMLITTLILLMEEILHQLRLVVYPIIYEVLYIPGSDSRISEPSTVGVRKKHRKYPNWETLGFLGKIGEP